MGMNAYIGTVQGNFPAQLSPQFGMGSQPVSPQPMPNAGYVPYGMQQVGFCVILLTH